MFEVTDYGLNEDAWEAIIAEDKFQINKWGYQTHSLFEWLAYTGEEFGELCQSVCEHEYRGGSLDDIIAEATQVATLAIKIAQMCKEAKNGSMVDE